MDDSNRRFRLIFLLLSGLLLLAGGLAWVWYEQDKSAQLADEDAILMGQPVASGPSPGDAPQQIAAAPSRPTTPGSSEEAARPANDSTGSAAVSPPAQPAQTMKTAQPAESVKAVQTAETVKPAQPAETVETAQPAQTVKTAPSTAPESVKQAVPPQPIKAATKPAAAAPEAAGAKEGEEKVASEQPAERPALATTTAGLLPGRVPALSRDEAIAIASRGTGRHDPTDPLSAHPFPRKKAAAPKPVVDVPPPPAIDEKLIPPPPPVSDEASAGLPLPMDMIPAPPDRPTINQKMKLLAIIDDRVLVSFPRYLQKQNKWPEIISMAPGEQFESISVVEVGRQQATFQEDGERFVKELDAR